MRSKSTRRPRPRTLAVAHTLGRGGKTDWPRSERLVLEPLRPEHAEELALVLDDVRLHRFIGGEPLGVEGLRARFQRQAGGWSPDGRERWLSWTVRERARGQAVGTIQATVTSEGPRVVAQLAWVIGRHHQHHGFAKEAASTAAVWLEDRGITRLTAYIHPGHHASMAVARAVGLRPTTAMVNGEIRWESLPRSGGKRRPHGHRIPSSPRDA